MQQSTMLHSTMLCAMMPHTELNNATPWRRPSLQQKDILNNKPFCRSTTVSLIIVSNPKQEAHSKTQQNKWIVWLHVVLFIKL
jgi:hypothetical protein